MSVLHEIFRDPLPILVQGDRYIPVIIKPESGLPIVNFIILHPLYVTASSPRLRFGPDVMRKCIKLGRNPLTSKGLAH
jgi:hypothetical protein